MKMPQYRRHLLPPLASLGIMALGACAAPQPSAVPSAATNVQAAPGPGYVTITWEHDGVGVEEFEVVRESSATVSRAAVTSVGSVPADSRSMVDHGAGIGTSNTYAVIVHGAAGSSAPAAADGGPVSIQSGVDLVVGTHNDSRMAQPGTAFVGYTFFAPDDMPVAPPAASISGPPAWAGGTTPAIVTMDTLARGFFFIANAHPLVDGTYELVVDTADATYTATTAPLDPTDLLPRPIGILASGVSADGLTASWQPVPGAVSYFVHITGTLHRQSTTSTSVTFSELDLAPGAYSVGVMAINLDLTAAWAPVKPAQLYTSFEESAEFTIE